MAPNQNILMIEKEHIKFLNFPKEDVLKKKKDQLNLRANLDRALTLGNLERQKVSISFVDSTGLKMVKTTIWGITDSAVILKRSTIIPLSRIVGIKLI